jgi:hypothetical protein
MAKPRYQRFMDVVDVLTTFAEPQKAAPQAAQFLFTPKALEEATKKGMKLFARNVKRGSPMYDAMKEAYKRDIIVGRMLTPGAEQHAKKTGRQVYGQAFESQLRRPGGEAISQIGVAEISPDEAATILHEWGHRGFKNLPIEHKRLLQKVTQKGKGLNILGRSPTGHHKKAIAGAASPATMAEESVMYTMQDLATTGTTEAPDALAAFVKDLMGWR